MDVNPKTVGSNSAPGKLIWQTESGPEDLPYNLNERSWKTVFLQGPFGGFHVLFALKETIEVLGLNTQLPLRKTTKQMPHVLTPCEV